MSNPTTVTTSINPVGPPKITLRRALKEVEKGKQYFVSDVLVQSAASRHYVFIEPTRTTINYYLSFKFSAYPEVGVFLHEGTGSLVTGSGTLLQPYNLNRNVATGSLRVLKALETGSGATGSLIFNGYVPDWSTKTIGDVDTNILLLNPSNLYILAFSGSAAGKINYEIYWNEE